MTRILVVALALVSATACTSIRDLQKPPRNAYENPFYAKYLDTGSALDAEIRAALESLRQNPDSPEPHNRIGALLVDKGFPKDAEREFERAINVNRRYHPAWYNLGLVRASRGDELGARRAYLRTIALKPGHAAALFQLGLIEEKRGHIDRAVSLYAKAYGINPSLLDIEVNPRVLETRLIHMALLQLYPIQNTRESMQFQDAPSIGSTAVRAIPSPAPAQETQQQVIAPAPVTDPAIEPAAPPPQPRPARRRRPATPSNE